MSEPKNVELIQGAGGKAMAEMLNSVIVPPLVEGWDMPGKGELGLRDLDDSSTGEGLAITADMYTVRPLFFPGGDIGALSVCGTVNDISMVGARPLALALSLLIEAGFPVKDLKRIMDSVGKTSRQADVAVVTGDTKVVENGSVDSLYVNTAGIGKAGPELEHNLGVVEEYRKKEGVWLRDRDIRNGDVIMINGYVGDHGVAVMSEREGYGFDTEIKSDVQPLNGIMKEALEVGGVVAAKDPTRGGVANLLNEWREKSGVGMRIDETALPVRAEVNAACDLLGIDPLAIGNEGKAVLAVVPDMAQEVLKRLKKTAGGENSAIIGKATSDERYVVLETEVGGKRIVEAPAGDPVPRIC